MGFSCKPIHVSEFKYAVVKVFVRLFFLVVCFFVAYPINPQPISEYLVFRSCSHLYGLQLLCIYSLLCGQEL